MKLQIFTSVTASLFLAQGAFAACGPPDATQVKGQDLTTLLSGKTVCASQGGDTWQEEHRGGGELWDYKRGPKDPIDPTEKVGNWSVSGTGAGTRVTHDYGSGGSYSFTVWEDKNGGSYSFCNGKEIPFTLTGIGGGC